MEDRLCPRCERLLPSHYFTPSHRICKVCNSRAQGRRAKTCVHSSLVKDKPGLTCSACGARWRKKNVFVGGHKFAGFTWDAE